MLKLKQLYPVLLLVLILGPAVWELRDRPEAPVIVAVARRPEPVLVAPPATPGAWFELMRPRCTPASVQLSVDLQPPPEGTHGTGYEAACFALASDIAKARALVLGLPEENRLEAVSVVFNVAQAMVEGGQETAAGPLMELVVEFWPRHYVALYQAGVTRYAAGDYTHARLYLARFLEVYIQSDHRTARARRMIDEMAEM